mgnify:CR=1 FL=1
MPSFDSDGVTIDYLDEGEGPLVVLVHGFASNRVVNWVNTGWVKMLTDGGHRVVALDNRGHGRSEKLYDSAAYQTDRMAEDVVRLIDTLDAGKAVLMGYSMGARISAFAARAVPERFDAVVLSGLASNLVDGVRGAEAIAEALKAPSAGAVQNHAARAFRVFADQTGADRDALAACILASRQTLTEAEAGEIAVPVLVVAGDKDDIAGSADDLARLIPGARAVTLPGRDHMTAVGDKGHKAAVVEFLAEVLG